MTIEQQPPGKHPPLGLSRRVFAGAGALAAAATLVWPALHAQTPPEMRKLTICVGGQSGFHCLPLTLAAQLGYFRAEGLAVEISDFDSSAQALQAFTRGAAEVCCAGFEYILRLQAGGQMCQSFVLQGRAPQMALGVSTRNLPHYRWAADLKGKKIGVPALDSTGALTAGLALAQGGLRLGEVRFVAVGKTESALAALRSGEVDAISHTDPLMTMLEQKGEVRIISDTRTLKGTAEVFGGPMPATCLFASQDFVEKNPNTCQALASAIVRGLKWLQTAGPGDLIKAVPEGYLLGDRGLYIASFNKLRESISLDGVLDDDAPATALKALARLDAGFKADRIDLEKTHTNEFAQRAKERFKA